MTTEALLILNPSQMGIQRKNDLLLSSSAIVATCLAPQSKNMTI